MTTDPNTKVTIWEAEERPAHSHMFYAFSKLTFELNEITRDYDRNRGAVIPPTDSRYRPDQRLLETGQPQQSNEIKRSGVD